MTETPDLPGLLKEEHEIRPTRFTGSTTAALLGMDPHTSPSDAWKLNLGIAEFKGNEFADAGNDMEDGIANMCKRALGINLYKPSSILHPDMEHLFVVHPDRLSVNGNLGIQIKNHIPALMTLKRDSWRYHAHPGATGIWDNFHVPKAYLVQCIVEMNIVAAAMGAEWGEQWLLASYFGGPNLRLYTIKNDPELWDGIVHAAQIFWRDHLDPKGPQLEPSDANWVPKGADPQRAKPLTGIDLLNSPLPEYSKG